LLDFPLIFFAHFTADSTLVIHLHGSKSGDYVNLVIFLSAVFVSIFFQDFQDFLVFKSSLKSLIFTNEANPQQSIPLKEINVWKGILGFYSNDTRFDLWWWLKVVLTNLDQVIDL
jgi:hypothetical protein